MNKSSSSSLFDNKQIFIFQKKKRDNFQKALGLGPLVSCFLGCFQKKKKKFNQDFQFFQKNSRFPNLSNFFFSKVPRKIFIKFLLATKNRKP